MQIVEGLAAIGVSDSPSGATEIADIEAFVEQLRAIEANTGCAVQAFDARLIGGHAHLKTAVEHANRSVARDENVAADRSIEILCYAAGTRQIEEAMGIGVSQGVTPVVVVVDRGRLGVPESQAPLGDGGDEDAAVTAVQELLAPSDTLGQIDEDALMRFFDISETERAATSADLETLVRERVALLDVEK